MFDTGEHGVGGRLGTRSSADGSLKGAPPGAALVFDHAAQYFTAADPAFKAMVADWQAAGVVEEWQGPVGTLHGGAFTPDASTEPRYVARGGMRCLASHLAAQATQALRDSSGGGGSSVEIKSEWLCTCAAERRESLQACLHAAMRPLSCCSRWMKPAARPSLAASHTGLVEVRRPQWVSEARHTADGWQLVGRGREQGLFDVTVVAHNGS